mmetsp:Transcript_33979/g.41909  ORF Transcript_33979/g.41909 Transcript_33979/m.41909 type:complete len:144 (+) Transcript_33979:161-592(+)
METVANFVTIFLPKYLHSLPIPDTLEKWAYLSIDQWVLLLPFLSLSFIILRFAVGGMRRLCKRSRIPVVGVRTDENHINPYILKKEEKVVHAISLNDIEDSHVAICRCWRSSQFPYCDGSHNAWNEQCGDNVGPLVLVKEHRE